MKAKRSEKYIKMIILQKKKIVVLTDNADSEKPWAESSNLFRKNFMNTKCADNTFDTRDIQEKKIDESEIFLSPWLKKAVH